VSNRSLFLGEPPLRVGLIGYGAIAQEVAHLLAERTATDIMIVGALVRHPTAPRPAGSPTIVATLSALLAQRPHVIVEVAGQEGLREHGPGVLRAGVDLLFVSVGALAKQETFNDLLTAAQSGNAQAKVVSGAIGALDALAAASLEELRRVVHTMRRVPTSLLSVEEAARLTAPYEVFRGTARQAAHQFPEFLNVAAAVALASKGLDQTEVRVIADPAVKHSIHEVLAEGTFGVLRFEIENVPMHLSARGARLVAMSVVHTLQQRRAYLMIG
jgi:aspartate dehydrogenase